MTGYDELFRIMEDPVAFISCLSIVDKTGKLIRLEPNEEQLKILEALCTGDDTAVLKARQIGSSTIVSAYLFWRLYTATEPVTIAILSHKLASSKHLLEIHKTFYHSLPKFMRRPLSVENTIEMKFADSGASIIAVSAEGKGGLRSFTCSYLQISEYAFAPNPEELKATAVSALNNGQLILETTANHFNDAMHQEVMRYERGEVKLKYLFFAWYDHKAYQLSIPTDEQVEWSDEELLEKGKYSLTWEQLYWRRWKIGQLGNMQKFRREYPANIEDAYSVAGNIYLSREDLEDVEVLQVEALEQTTFSLPDKDDKYAIGVDISAGVGRDYSVIYVLSKKTHSPVCVYRSNMVTPVYLAERVVNLAKYYNNALVLCESNNYGHVVIRELHHLGYTNIWQENGKDWLTTLNSKTRMFENLKKNITSGYVRHIDNLAYAELRAITVNDKGHIELANVDGSHSDSAVALALAYICLDSISLKNNTTFLPAWVKKKNARKTVQTAGASISRHRRY